MDLFSLSKVSILILLGGSISSACGYEKPPSCDPGLNCGYEDVCYRNVNSPSGNRDASDTCKNTIDFSAAVELCDYSGTTNVSNALGNLVYGKLKVCVTAVQGLGYLPFIWACYYDWQPAYRVQVLLTHILAIPFIIAPGKTYCILFIGGCPEIILIKPDNVIIPGLGLTGLEITKMYYIVVAEPYTVNCNPIPGYFLLDYPSGGDGIQNPIIKLEVQNAIAFQYYPFNMSIQDVNKEASNRIIDAAVDIKQGEGYVEVTQIGATKSATCSILSAGVTISDVIGVAAGDVGITGQLSLPTACSSIAGIVTQLSETAFVGYFQPFRLFLVSCCGGALLQGYTFNDITVPMTNAMYSGCYHNSCR